MGSVVFIDNNIFEISNGGNTLVGFCDNPDVNNFIDSHFNVYHINSDIANNPFSYAIVDNGNVLTLTITNGNGDTAIYRNEVLNLEDNTLSQLQLFYSPVLQDVVLSGPEQEIKASIYSLTGQRQHTIVQSSNKPISVSELSLGVYIVSITNFNNESQTYKFVKR